MKEPESCVEQLLEVWQKHRDAEHLAAEAARDGHQRDLDRMLKEKLDSMRRKCAQPMGQRRQEHRACTAAALSRGT